MGVVFDTLHEEMMQAACVAADAVTAEKYAEAFEGLGRVLELGERALASDGDPVENVLLQLFVTKTKDTHRNVYMQLMGDTDRMLVVGVLEALTALDIVSVGGPKLSDQLAMIYSGAADRLDSPHDILRAVYDGEHNVPPQLRKLVRSFIAGDISKDATAAKLREHAETVRKHIEVLFSEGASE